MRCAASDFICVILIPDGEQPFRRFHFRELRERELIQAIIRGTDQQRNTSGVRIAERKLVKESEQQYPKSMTPTSQPRSGRLYTLFV